MGNTSFVALSGRSMYISRQTPASPMTTAWLKSGHIVCCSELPQNTQDLKRFADAVATYLEQPGREDIRVLWLEKPVFHPADVTARWIELRERNGVTETNASSLSFGNWSFYWSAGTAVMMDENGITFGAGRYPNYFAVDTAGKKRFFTLDKTFRLAFQENGPVFEWEMNLDASALESLDLCQRYFFPAIHKSAAQANPADIHAFELQGYVASLRAPVLDLRKARRFLFRIDPLAPLDHERSYLIALSDDIFASFFRTILGYPVSLKPLAGLKWVLNAKKVYASSADTLQSSASGDAVADPVAGASVAAYYIAPSGDFALTVDTGASAGGDPPADLLCGTSGAEYVNIGESGQTPVRVRFVPDKPAGIDAAYAFETGDSDTKVAAHYRNLNAGAATSWVYLFSPDRNLEYFAQPDRSVMHHADDDAATLHLDYLPLFAGRLSPADSSFPMLAYAGVDRIRDKDLPYVSIDDYVSVEAQILQPARRQIVEDLQHDSSGAGGNALWGVTPYGFRFDLGSDINRWQRLNLAKSYDIVKTFAGAGLPPSVQKVPLDLSLFDLRGKLKSALLSNQQFIVLSNNDKLNEFSSRHVDTSLLKVQDWGFSIAPEQWLNGSTAIVFKFHDQSLFQLLNAADAWTNATAFNDDTEQIRDMLISRLGPDAPERKDPDYRIFFDEVVDKPSWNGLLLLNVRVPLDTLPDEIKGIAAGIRQPEAFFAHHIGVALTPLNEDAAQQQSSIFGILDYKDETPLSEGEDSGAGDEAIYDFKVTKLKVSFANSQIQSFACKIDFLVKKLFGAPVLLPGGTRILTILGTYQKHDGEGSYLFRTEKESLFSATDGVLEQILVDQVQFRTLLSKGGQSGSADEPIRAQFAFTGRIRFKKMKGFDAFSFGNLLSSGTEKTLLFDGGLNFSELSVDLVFPPKTPQDRTFSFDAFDTQVDVRASRPRPGSFYKHFPLRFRTVVQGSPSATPASMGYMPIDSPLTGGSLGAEWYGLDFELNLGSPGLLGAKIDFKTSVLLAWSPRETGYASFLGIKIPGVSGGKREIDIQGVLKLAFGEVRFFVNETGTPADLHATILLQFKEIQLKFFTLAFPRLGQTNILLFGNPEGEDRETVGWFAAYDSGIAYVRPGGPDDVSQPGSGI